MSVIDVSAHIRECTISGQYARALVLGRDALRERPNDFAVLAALLELTALLRAECMDLAVRKMDSGPTYMDKEELLMDISLLTGQDVYGRPTA